MAKRALMGTALLAVGGALGLVSSASAAPLVSLTPSFSGGASLGEPAAATASLSIAGTGWDRGGIDGLCHVQRRNAQDDGSYRLPSGIPGRTHY